MVPALSSAAGVPHASLCCCQVYHSSFNDVDAPTLLGCGLYPLRTKFPGPLPIAGELITPMGRGLIGF